jgi:putative ATPase
MDNLSPLAWRLRPKKLNEFVGQKSIINNNSWLYQAIKNDKLSSLVFWGPPGTGKTTLALIIAKEIKADFVQLSATSSGVKDLKEIIKRAKESRALAIKTLLFIDEIHRWNKTQQDALLPEVERANLILIGATTENPSFSLNNALLSRLKVLVLEPLSKQDLSIILKKAIKELSVKITRQDLSLIINLADGDARRALNILESAAEQSNSINSEIIKGIVNKPNLLYDRNGENHYELISALHKSIRGNHIDASLYYLARMLEAGEDPLYIARRLIRLASEDISLANNSALLLANSVYDACLKIGMPECSVNLAHLVVYLAKSKKSIDVYLAYKKAKQEVEKSGNLAVPLHLRNASSALMKELGYGKDYKYPPLEDANNQDYLPKEIKNKRFFKD